MSKEIYMARSKLGLAVKARPEADHSAEYAALAAAKVKQYIEKTLSDVTLTAEQRNEIIAMILRETYES